MNIMFLRCTPLFPAVSASVITFDGLLPFETERETAKYVLTFIQRKEMSLDSICVFVVVCFASL